ncbi:MAG: DUF1304 family protein [Candidatus Paceibacterota bacterium]
MDIFSQIMVGLVALIHLYIWWLEMFNWRVFLKSLFGEVEVSPEFLSKTKILAL